MEIKDHQCPNCVEPIAFCMCGNNSLTVKSGIEHFEEVKSAKKVLEERLAAHQNQHDEQVIRKFVDWIGYEKNHRVYKLMELYIKEELKCLEHKS